VNNRILEAQWFFVKDGQQYGPIAGAELQSLLDNSHLLPGDLLWKSGWQDWKRVDLAFGPLAIPQTQSDAPRVPNYSVDTGAVCGDERITYENSPNSTTEDCGVHRKEDVGTATSGQNSSAKPESKKRKRLILPIFIGAASTVFGGVFLLFLQKDWQRPTPTIVKSELEKSYAQTGICLTVPVAFKCLSSRCSPPHLELYPNGDLRRLNALFNQLKEDKHIWYWRQLNGIGNPIRLYLRETDNVIVDPKTEDKVFSRHYLLCPQVGRYQVENINVDEGRNDIYKVRYSLTLLPKHSNYSGFLSQQYPIEVNKEHIALFNKLNGKWQMKLLKN